jgi:hypothetical protein
VITASKLELGMLCAPAFALEHSDVRVHGSDPERGKAEHADDEALILAGNTPDELERRWPGYTWQAEVKVFYDLVNDVGGIVGYGNDRGYEDRGPFVVFGTADIIGRSPDGTAVVVVDRKGYNEQTPAYRNPQVSILALAVTRAYGLRSADVAIWPRAAALDVAELGAMDLDAFAAEAKGALVEVMRAKETHKNGGPLKFNEGRHCQYCPAFAACPQKQALALTLKGEPALRLSLENDKDAADAYEFARRVRELLKRLDAAVYARAAQRPIPLADGRMLGQVSKQGNEKLDGDAVWSVVAERHGRDIADTAVIRTATKSRLKEALSFAGVASAAKAEREILDAVRARGGASRKETTAIEVYEPQKLLKVVGE